MKRVVKNEPRSARRTLGMAAALGLAVAGLANAPAASAAVPAFPNNLVVFPDRDFVSVEGYSEHEGETATLEVTRPGVGVMGSAKAKVSGTGVAFEVNHPGGVCWGAGTSHDVTPDIKAGDVVSIKFPDGSGDETTTSTATVTEDMTRNGQTVTVKGRLGPDVGPANIEQRIINPDLVDVVGKRDVRALPGPLVPAPRGGYSSGLDVNADGTFLATYEFDTLEGATTTAAADLGERAMAWQMVDADGNRQGLTIAEFGEAGGPGMGGCPQGPTNQAAPAGAASAVRPGDKTSALVKWTPATAQPGAAPVTGYSVEAVNSSTETVQGVRLAADATQATLTGLDPAGPYTFEVRSMAGDKMSVPFAMGGGGTSGGAAGDTTIPTLSVSPAGGADPASAVETNSVTVNSNGQVYFTADGSPAVIGDSPTDNARLYTGPIPITGPTTLNVATFDAVGNHDQTTGEYKPVSVQAPGAPAGLSGTQSQSSVALTWGAVTDADSYQVTVYDGVGAKLAAAKQPPVTSVPKQTVTGLSPGAPYQFSVVARNVGGSSVDSAMFAKATDPLTDQITITSAKWKAGDFRIVGSGNMVGRTVQAYRVNANGTRGAAITGATAAVVAAAPPGIGDYSIRQRANVPATNPGKIFVVSNGGGAAGPFTVTNG
jgi:hypothetical protein